MNIKKNIKNKYILTVAVFFCSAIFLTFKIGMADNSISQIDEQNSDTSETEKKLEELKERAAVYRQIIDIKKKQSSTLSDQLSITDSNMQQIKAEIDASSQQINDYNAQIIRLTAQIKEKEKIIDSQKKILANLMQSYWETSQLNPINAYLSDGNFSKFLVTKDRLSQTGDKIKNLVDSVMELKTGLEAQSSELDTKKAEVVSAHQKLEQQNSNLQSVKSQRETLLAQTKGEEARYSQLLQRIEEQKQELLNIDQYFAASGLSVDSYPKPDSKYFASTSWYFSQRDPRWGDETIGNTKTLMKSYGCAVTAVAMVFKQHGGDVNPGSLSSAPIFSGDLINWPASWMSPKMVLTSSGKSHGNIDWSIIDSEISKDHPVIVYIGKTKGDGGHYVVIHHKDSSGKYVVHDPYFGPNLFLDTSRALVGAMGVDSGTIINQMIIYN